MRRLRLIVSDTVVGQLYQGISFYQNLGRLSIMGKALSSSDIRNFILLLVLVCSFQNTGSVGLSIVGLGAATLAYVALRARVHSLDFVERRTERFAAPSLRQSYFDVLNVSDSIFGFAYVVLGFTLRITSSLT
jgi:hypothetical protein